MAPPGASELAPSIIEPPRIVTTVRTEGVRTLASARALETIEAAYAALESLRAQQAQSQLNVVHERRRLQDQGELLLGALRVSRANPVTQPKSGVLTPPERGLASLLPEAEQRLNEVRASLEQQAKEAEETFVDLLTRAEALVKERVHRQAAVAPPSAKLTVQTLREEKRILHLQRPSPDDSITLLYALTGRLATRYGYLADDTTDDVMLSPPVLYPDLGVDPRILRPGAPQLKKILEANAVAWPVKGMLPLFLTSHPDRPLLRWLSRGPLLEAELEDGMGFRNILTREEAEQITGLLLAQSIARRISFELVRG